MLKYFYPGSESEVIVRWAVDEKGDSGRMKSKPRSDELSPPHQSGTC